MICYHLLDSATSQIVTQHITEQLTCKTLLMLSSLGTHFKANNMSNCVQGKQNIAATNRCCLLFTSLQLNKQVPQSGTCFQSGLITLDRLSRHLHGYTLLCLQHNRRHAVQTLLQQETENQSFLYNPPKIHSILSAPLQNHSGFLT